MTSLIQIGLICTVITIGFTVWAAMQQSQQGGQSMRDSIIESWSNIAIGFAINYVANLVVLPLAGLPVSPGGAFWIGTIFTAISVLRSFMLRRWFNGKTVSKARSA